MREEEWREEERGRERRPQNDITEVIFCNSEVLPTVFLPNEIKFYPLKRMKVPILNVIRDIL